VIVVGVGVVVDEVVGVDEGDAREIGQHVEAVVVLVADAGVEHRDDHAVAVGELPRLRHADLVEVPLVLVLRVIGEPGVGRLARRAVDLGGQEVLGRELDLEVGLGDLDLGPRLELVQDRVAARRVDVRAVELGRSGGVVDEGEPDPGVALDRGDRRRRRVVLEIDEDLVGLGRRRVGVALFVGEARAVVGLGAEVPPQGDDREEHQDP